MSLLACRQRVELEELRQQLEGSTTALTRALRADFERSQEEQEQRHQVGVPPPLGVPTRSGLQRKKGISFA